MKRVMWVIFPLSFSVSSLAQETPIFQHLGATDPQNEGFTLTLAAGGAVGPVIGDLGRESWSVVSSGAPASYSHSFTSHQQTTIAGSDWALSATFRIVQSPNIWMAFYTDSQQFALSFEMQPDGDPVVNSHSIQAPAFVLNGGGPGYHDYQLAYHAATGQASLWVDGSERVSDITGVPGFSGWTVFWGAAQGTASQANWNRVSFEVVPEPSPGIIMFTGGLLVVLRSLLAPRRWFRT